jgi:hypothetical protein
MVAISRMQSTHNFVLNVILIYYCAFFSIILEFSHI